MEQTLFLGKKHREISDEQLREILNENRRRNEELKKLGKYDPVIGDSDEGRRIRVLPTQFNDGSVWIPRTMLSDPQYSLVESREQWVRLRCRHDFEYWAYHCVTIRDKDSGETIPFKLNYPQRRLLHALEDDRLAGRPIRLILLKARQWGGSTLIQHYMAWIQTCLRRNWNSLICGHVKDAATNIRAMYSRLLANYPEQYWDGDETPGFKPLERSTNIRVISGRECRVTVGSSENQDAVRGADYQMAHLSEVAFWRDTPQCNPDNFIRAICGAINNTPMTLVVLESTANGVGNYFHREWLRAKSGESDKQHIFVPWHEIEIYRRPVDDPRRLCCGMDGYEQQLWDDGLTLEMIAWFHYKRREYQTLRQMQAEYPSTDTEAFYSVDSNVFDTDRLDAMRRTCHYPPFIGEIIGQRTIGAHALDNLKLKPDEAGHLKIWTPPAPGRNRYIVTVDIGGRSPTSDLSVIAVLDRAGGPTGKTPEIAAQWRGHLDHDLLAWKSAQIARFYNNALLVIESNSFETDEPDASASLLTTIGRHYHNLYRRHGPARSSPGRRAPAGFHTNRATKIAVIDKLIAAVREGSYVERDGEAIDEMSTYRMGINGTFGAMAGYHDDILMTRAIGLYVSDDISPATNVRDDSLARYAAMAPRHDFFYPTRR